MINPPVNATVLMADGGMADPFSGSGMGRENLSTEGGQSLDFTNAPPPLEIVVNTKTGTTTVIDVRSPETTISEMPSSRSGIDIMKTAQEVLKTVGTGLGALKIAGDVGALPLTAIYGGGGSGLGLPGTAGGLMAARALMATAAGGVTAAALTGLTIGTGVDWIITRIAGESIGEMIYDKLHPGE